MHPQRIQVRRIKGWRLPDGAVYVGRPTRWGNPFRLGHDGATRAEVVDLFRAHFESLPQAEREALLAPLRGRPLACWCPLDGPCHADVLLEFANRGSAP
jgi:hypothetical protein